MVVVDGWLTDDNNNKGIMVQAGRVCDGRCALGVHWLVFRHNIYPVLFFTMCTTMNPSCCCDVFTVLLTKTECLTHA